MMKFGVVAPFASIHDVIARAKEAEAAGWDGFFIGDGIWSDDPWVTLAAVAASTTRIRIGPLLTPVSRRRPSKLASETATLDRLSNGRVILSVGMGALDTGFAAFGEATDRKTRAELLDEGLDIVTGLWKGQPFSYKGKHYTVKRIKSAFPKPVQQPRIPIWAVGLVGSEKSMNRAFRWDGVLPNVKSASGHWSRPTADDIRAIAAEARQKRTQEAPFDIVVEGDTPLGDPAAAVEKVRPLAQAGATWWIESLWEAPSAKFIRDRIQQGPPRW